MTGTLTFDVYTCRLFVLQHEIQKPAWSLYLILQLVEGGNGWKFFMFHILNICFSEK